MKNGYDTPDGLLFQMSKNYNFLFEDYCQHIMEQVGLTDQHLYTEGVLDLHQWTIKVRRQCAQFFTETAK